MVPKKSRWRIEWADGVWSWYNWNIGLYAYISYSQSLFDFTRTYWFYFLRGFIKCQYVAEAGIIANVVLNVTILTSWCKWRDLTSVGSQFVDEDSVSASEWCDATGWHLIIVSSLGNKNNNTFNGPFIHDDLCEPITEKETSAVSSTYSLQKQFKLLV